MKKLSSLTYTIPTRGQDTYLNLPEQVVEFISEGSVVPQPDGTTLYFFPFVLQKYSKDYGGSIFRVRELSDFRPIDIGMPFYDIRKWTEEQIQEYVDRYKASEGANYQEKATNWGKSVDVNKDAPAEGIKMSTQKRIYVGIYRKGGNVGEIWAQASEGLYWCATRNKTMTQAQIDSDVRNGYLIEAKK